MNNDVIKNQGFVYKIAKKYAPVNSADYEDYCQEGFIALNKALECFDINKGIKFSTYAWTIIERDILRYISNNSRNIRIPENVYSDNAKIHKIETEYKLRKGSAPSTEEISKITGLSIQRINNVKNIFNNPEFSLHTKLNVKENNQDSEFLDIYAGNTYKNPEEDLMNRSRSELCHNLLNSLDAEKREVLLDRFGFNGKKLTHREIGEKLGFSKQRSKQIETAALKMLEAIAKKQNLEVYI